ncbi:sensor histidine kinase [Corynebacterium glutamicum]|uniref:sensor histidine kinase n=1 Tax=Corynebacterium glutamicum TaxID=1718 RepID=UPI0007C5FB9D|nr:sensor histidine kinase [Corynebacterium glutamicum]ANE09546.1 ATPase [Corynebacterium glutamicum]
MQSSLDRVSETGRNELDVETLVKKGNQPGATSYRNSIHILTASLLVVGLGASARLTLPMFALSCVLLFVWGFLYFYGSTKRVDLRHGMQLGWLFVLTLVWIFMVPIVPVSIYLLFPLFFLYLQVMPDVRGIIAILGATAIAIASQYSVGLTFGGVMGPVVSAIVTVAIDYAFRTLWRVNNEKQELIDQLIETRSQLAVTERNAGIAAERQRIAHEIHDTVAQGLSSIQMLLHVSEQEILVAEMEEKPKEAIVKKMRLARQTASDNLSEARAMIAALQPAALSKTSLEAALHRVTEPLLGINFVISVDGDVRQLPMKTEATLLRIAQGAIGNVAKHSEAKNCHVTLTYEDTEVRLDVVDDGVGFEPSEVSSTPAGLGHIGLTALQQRTMELHGEVIVESAYGQGTAVSAALPVEPPEGFVGAPVLADSDSSATGEVELSSPTDDE